MAVRDAAVVRGGGGAAVVRGDMALAGKRWQSCSERGLKMMGEER